MRCAPYRRSDDLIRTAEPTDRYPWASSSPARMLFDKTNPPKKINCIWYSRYDPANPPQNRLSRPQISRRRLTKENLQGSSLDVYSPPDRLPARTRGGVRAPQPPAAVPDRLHAPGRLMAQSRRYHPGRLA